MSDRASFRRSLLYFGAAFSAAIILSKIGFAALGIEEIAEGWYWLFHSVIVACIALVAMVLAYPLRPASSSMFMKMALLTYGASFFLTGLIVAGAGLTLAALQWVGYIPHFGHDSPLFTHWDAIGMRFYWDCLRKDHLLANVIYHGLGGSFETLREPINHLAHVHRAFYVAAALLFAVLAFFGASHRRIAAGLAAALSSALAIAGIVVVVGAYRLHLHTSTPCLQQALDATGDRTAEDQVRMLAELHAARIGTSRREMSLTGVEARRRSLILRVRIHERVTDAVGFRSWVDGFREREVRDFCEGNRWPASFHKLGIIHVWVLRYADTDLTETVVVGADQCTR